MAVRPIFIPQISGRVGVLEKILEFKWYPGMSKSQKQKSINELHKTAKNMGFEKVLEVSSKSEVDTGVSLSAFNLIITTKKHSNQFTVETAFQGSKVFECGGPYKDLIGMNSLAAKKDIRLKESGGLKAFEFFGMSFPLTPRTFFYDWLYINALVQNTDLENKILMFDGFSDIEFNPKKSINCQAHAVALYVSLKRNNFLIDALKSPEDFLSITRSHYLNQSRNIDVQNTLI